MSSLAELPEVVGFFSYSRDDDESFQGTLSALRVAIQRELGAQLGRNSRNFRLWQDHAAIAPGTLWKSEIINAVAEAAFFIPTITPRVVNSEYCQFEFESFLAREKSLGRSDLVFPLLYISVPGLDDPAKRASDPILSIVAARQYVDWRQYRYLDVQSPTVRQAIGEFSGAIAKALSLPWVSPAERARQEEEQRIRAEAEARRRAEESERQRLADIAARERVEEQKRRDVAEAKRRAEEAAKRQAAQARREADEPKTVQKTDEMLQRPDDGNAARERPAATPMLLWARITRVIALGIFILAMISAVPGAGAVVLLLLGVFFPALERPYDNLLGNVLTGSVVATIASFAVAFLLAFILPDKKKFKESDQSR
jgi:hypothetical protein